MAEEVATSDEAEVDVDVVASGEKNPIFPPDHTLIRNGRFLATMRRARYFLSAIKMNHARSMWSRYRNSPFLISPIFRLDRTLVQQPQGRNRVPVTV